MSVTKRFIAIAALGIFVLLAAAFLNLYTALFFIYNFLAFGILLIDYLVSPSKNIFVISRLGSDKLYFKTGNQIEIQVRNNFHRPALVQLKDQIPDWHFQLLSHDLKGKIESMEHKTFSYEVLPSKRGSFEFPRVYVKYTGLLGLCVKYFEYELPIEYKVYPNLKDLTAYRLVMQKSNRLISGNRRIPLKALGKEFESLRQYVDGDDYRFVNWMATARENKLLINQYEAEKNQQVMVLLDAGRAMSYSIHGYQKLDYAINAALILLDIAMQKGDAGGLMVFETDIKTYVRPGKGEAQRNLLMEHLYHVEGVKYTPHYREAFIYLAQQQKRRSLVFLFTDFQTLGEADELLSSLHIITKNHIPIIILMKNESILRISQQESQNATQLYQQAVALDLLEERKALIKALRSKKIVCIESDSENFAAHTVNQYLLLRRV